MKVAMVCPYAISRPGGVQGQALGLASALAKSGHRMTVFAPADRGFRPEAVGLDPRSFVSLGRVVAVPANGSVAPLSLSPGAFRDALRALRREGFDVVHLHEPLAPGPSYACLLQGSVPKVGTFHRAGPSAAYRLAAPVARWAANHLQVRCAVSEEAASTARSALGGTYETIGNGVDLERFERTGSSKPWPTDGPTVLFVGRHEPRKGLGILLDAFEVAVRRFVTDSGDGGTPPTLWIAGEGSQTGVLRRRHPPGAHLQWLGRISDGDLTSRLLGAHVLCAPSLRGESFGVVLLEAMAARCFVVSSDIPGYASVVGPHGALVAPGDVDSLASVLVGCFGSVRRSGSGATEEMLGAAAAHAAQWSMTAIAARYESMYGGVVM